MHRISYIDSHTGGEPTRVVLAGFPSLDAPTMAERVQQLRAQDQYRRACVLEPRASDVMVGAVLTAPISEGAVVGVIFFNNVGYLGMCGHGTIGLIATLLHCGKISYGRHLIDTPVGVISAVLNPDQSVTVNNVASYRYQADVSVDVPGHGLVIGDIAWGGNWFFLVKNYSQQINRARATELTVFTLAIQQALQRAGITGANGSVIDHIELFDAPLDPANHSRNFVLCPGGAYDRSACGTGTSAKLACLAADGKLAAGAVWRQESVVGSVFSASYQASPDHDTASILPSIAGSAYVCGEGTLLIDPRDPFAWGIAD
jgi:4-hydroxyproline epimerase